VITGLERDYAAMNEMILSEALAFETMMDSLQALEKRINAEK